MSTEIASLGINQIIISSLNSAFRTLLRSCAENVNNNFDNLKDMSTEDRLETIIRMFGLEEEDAVKIIKPAPKKSAASADGTTPKKTGKPRAEKPLPLPFWGEKTVERTKCQGIQGALFNQCTKSPIDGSIYCKKCKDEADKNAEDHGMPNRGNIQSRLEQFADDYYGYTTPDNKCRKIYIGSWAEKKKLSNEQVLEIFTKNGIELKPKDKQNMFFVPPKKEKSKNKLTDGMDEKPKGKRVKKPTPGVPSPIDDDDDVNDVDDDVNDVDDDESTVATQVDDDDDESTVATQVDDDVDDVDDVDIDIPDPEPELNIKDFTTIKIGKNKYDPRYAVLKESIKAYKKNNSVSAEVFEIIDYNEENKTFKIFNNEPIGKLCNNKVTVYTVYK